MLLGIFFLNKELNRPHVLRDEMIFMHCSLQIKQNIYSIGIFRAPVLTQFTVKVKKKRKKVPFLKVYHYSFSQYFPNVKAVVVQAVITLYNLIKMSWHQIVNLSNQDRK